MSRQASGKSGLHSDAQKDSVRDLTGEAQRSVVNGAFRSAGRHNNSSLRSITNAANGGDPHMVEDVEPETIHRGTHTTYEE
jgi:hypothetical protein